MPPVPILTPKEVIKVFQKLGWEIARQKGSHIIMTRAGHISTLSIPNHNEVARGTLRSLISKAGLTTEDFVKMLNS